jgi:hypothetical protein
LATSTIFAAKAAIFKLLSTDVTISGQQIQVSYGVPLPNPKDECIWLGDVNPGQEISAAMGQLRRQEDYDIIGYVEVYQRSNDQQTCTERAGTIFGMVENVIRPIPALTISGVPVTNLIRCVMSGPLSVTEGYGVKETARMARIQFVFGCSARI